jgi:hypothetical protein
MCADTLPNRVLNTDWEVCKPGVGCITYDSSPTPKLFCEVKTYDFSRNQFLIDIGILGTDRAQATDQARIAGLCGFEYCYVVAHPQHVPIIEGWNLTPDVRLRPECLTYPE